MHGLGIRHLAQVYKVIHNSEIHYAQALIGGELYARVVKREIE